ncbi:hypothetical protein HFC70_01655 [Agrobacterium sp. a22-2]|uniref:hypothetical protein n=1 Tax=Agrobacterium sp. a22-2 TaxID=2283840 RepID=UPI00144612D6|nr:hypothetical protein [Agrobacterium sp. a22-2]NKN35053.1 hypothetical protein [Agrobacterium sp. a22-2]
MPSLKEVEHYLTGLWLLVLRDPKGFQYLDLSERGSLRSFWAVVWTLPAMLVSWIWWRSTYLEKMPPDTETGPLFFLRLAMIEASNWLLPLIFVGVLMLALGVGQKFSAVVVATNWMAIPVSYTYAFLILVMMLLPGAASLIVLLWFVAFFAVILALFRIIGMICGNQFAMVATLTMLLLVPSMILSEVLERFLGVFPG